MRKSARFLIGRAQSSSVEFSLAGMWLGLWVHNVVDASPGFLALLLGILYWAVAVTRLRWAVRLLRQEELSKEIGHLFVPGT